MAREYFCPRCLDQVTEESVQYRDRNGAAAAKPQLAYERGLAQWTKAIWLGDPKPLYQIDPQAKADSFERGVYALCPRGHRMPDHAFDLPSIVVGLVGESASGKTVYLGTLLEQLDRGRLLPYLDLEPDEHSEQLQNQIFGEFYRIGQVPEATAAGRSDAQREALTRTAKSEGVERFYLSFFDASGEQNKRQDHGTHNRFLFRADVVMHFITPEVVGLTGRTTGRRQDQRQQWHVTNAAVRSAASTAQPGTHAAVIIPKSDDIDPASLDMLTDARAELDYGHGLTLHRAYEIIEQDSHYIRGLLRATEDGRVLVDRIEDAYSSTTYHLVSATGGPADARLNRFPARRPQRVLDPLLAALVRVRMLNAREGRRALA